MNIKFTKEKIIKFILLIFVVIEMLLLVHSSLTMWNIRNSIDFSEVNSETCKKGTIVKGYVPAFLTREFNKYGGNALLAESHTFLSWGKEYSYYTVDLTNDEYIELIVDDREIKKEIKSNLTSTNKVYIEGEIINNLYGPNYLWYEDIPGFNSDKIIDKYAIIVVNLDQKKDLFKFNILGLIISLVVFVGYWRHTKL